MKTLFMLSLTSDIGFSIAKEFSKLGYRVLGTYRDEAAARKIMKANKNFDLLKCDISNESDIENLRTEFQKRNLKWEVAIFCPAQPYPYKNFFQSNFLEWEESFKTNSLNQLKVLHKIYDFRGELSTCIFFSSLGINKSVAAFSAYMTAKIHLLKMVEVLDFENSDMKFSIVGPGWVKTKTQLLALEKCDPSDERYIMTKKFLTDGIGTSMNDIFQLIRWIVVSDKEIVGGRNFSVVHDPWRTSSRSELENALKNDVDLYKLRRKEKSG